MAKNGSNEKLEKVLINKSKYMEKIKKSIKHIV